MGTNNQPEPAIVGPVALTEEFQIATAPTCKEFDPNVLLEAAPTGGKPMTEEEWAVAEQKACAQPQTPPPPTMGR